MAQNSASVRVTTDANGLTSFQAQLPNVHVTDATGMDVALVPPAAASVHCNPCVIAIDLPVRPPAPTLTTAFDWWVLLALAVPLVLATIFGAVIGWFVLCSKANLKKTVDKLAQLLSEGDSSKMSLSRVQALLFTYVITFGSMLIIVRTGQFPTEIPQDLAILSGGGLATYVISKAIQGSTNQMPPPTPPAKP